MGKTLSQAENEEITQALSVALETLVSGQLLSQAVAAAGEAAYHWSLGTDTLSWSVNAAAVLQRAAPDMDTGRKFASLLDADNLTTRFDAVMHASAARDAGEGVSFRIEYRIKETETAPAMWVEDSGCWFPDAEGRPKEVFGVVHPVTERHEQDQHLSFLSRNDALTGLMNRTRMTEALEDAISVAAKDGAPCAFSIATINNLDIINEAYGFEVGDEVITAVAERLRKVMRSGDGIARYSGGSFGIILNGCTPEELAVALDRYLLAVRDSVIETSKGPVWALLSIGAVTVPDDAENARLAMLRAEETLNRALQKSGDSFDIYAHSDDRETQRMLNARCAAEIIDCVRNGSFHLAYQPVLDPATRQPVLYEALLRLRDSAGEYVTAGHLIPIAERLGLIRLIDRAVLQLALETLHRFPEARLAINMSATTANDPRWNSQLVDLIAAAEPLNERLIIELTENIALSDLPVAIAFFKRLRAAGCCVAIDDFGSGFTMFNHLRELPIDIIKLDGIYCRDLASNMETRFLAKSLIDIARHFGIKTVAEWVETESDANVLVELGIDYLQGNYFAAPNVVAPWTAEDSPAFAFTEDKAAEIAEPEVSVAPEEPVVQAPAPVEAVYETADGEMTSAETAEADLVSEDGDEEELVFDDAEASLSRLKQALDELSLHFRPRETAGEGERLAG